MISKLGTILNIKKISKYMENRGWLGIVWGLMSHDARNSSKKKMSILLLRGKPKKDFQFGIDWYMRSTSGYRSLSGDFLPVNFVRIVSDSGLFWSPELTNRFYGTMRETLSNYLPEYNLKLSRLRVLPNRTPDERGLTPVLSRDIKSAGRLPLHHSVNGLCFDDDTDLGNYLRDNIRFFARVRGSARVNNGTRRFNHWKIGPIRA